MVEAIKETYEEAMRRVTENKQKNAQEAEMGREGIALTIEIAGRHEKELRELIGQNGGANILEPIMRGPVTAERLLEEFEKLARERGVYAPEMYRIMGRINFTGRRFGQTAFLQIVMLGSKKFLEKDTS